MTLWVDEKYLKMLSPRMEGFTQKDSHLWNCKCHYCGDSKKKKNKKRGYFYQNEGILFYRCFNCNVSEKFTSFLYKFDYSMYRQLSLEKFGDRNERKVVKAHELKIPKTRKYISNIFESLPNVKDLPKNHYALNEVVRRCLPIDEIDVYFAEDFIEWTKGNNDKFKHWKGEDHSRIVIPWKDRLGSIIGYTARAFGSDNDPKYYRIKMDESKEAYFGMENLDESKQVYVLEGEIDSMMIPNAIAVGNGKLHVYMNKDAIYIPDADKRNPHICKVISDMIKLNLNVCLMPDKISAKDLNELKVNGWSEEQILKMIKDNTYKGLSALTMFNKWKKC